MTKAGIVTKALPWMMEALPDGEYHTRFVGVRVTDDWADLIDPTNNFLCKFLISKTKGVLEVYLANKPPFIKVYTAGLKPDSKWELVLGEFKRQLRKDKEAYTKHQATIDNVFGKMRAGLK
jgi:hypothetical protein